MYCSSENGNRFDAETLIRECEDKFGGIGIKHQAKSISAAKASDLKPINIRLQEAKADLLPSIKPRRYQEELFLKCLQDNVIIYLGTGLGKTYITVLVLNSPKFDMLIRSGRKVVFLAPTQDLVKQQAEYIYTKVPYKVRVYCGQTAQLGVHIDHWQTSTWEAELRQIDILFMTPQIFSSAISTGFLRWEQFSLVIFDEVHHAATSKREKSGKNSGAPYSQALAHFNAVHKIRYLPEKPRFIGLTASLINNMPNDVDSIHRGILDLERKLTARCVTDITAIEYKPHMVIFKYTKPSICRANDKIIEILGDCCKLLEAALDLAKARKTSLVGPKDDEDKEVIAYHNRLKLAASGFSIKPGSFHKIIKQLIAIRINSGMWTFTNICLNLYKAVVKHSQSQVITHSIKPMYTEFVSLLRALVFMSNQLLGEIPDEYILSYSQPKLLCLLEVLKQEYCRTIDHTSAKSTFSCIVFVKSRIEVVAICGWLQKVSASIPGYDFLKVDYAIGLAATMTSKWACITKRKSTEQVAMLNKFRNLDLNVIVTTSVLEEGIDLPVCSTVIRYDTADTFRVYVQSRGRARQKASSFIALCDMSAEDETRKRLVKFNDFEDKVKEILSDQNRSSLPKRQESNDQHAIAGDPEQEDIFLDIEKGIRIDSSMAKIILNMYCSRLSRNHPYSDGLTYEQDETNGLFTTTLYFPAGCPIKEGIRGGSRKTTHLADSSAIIAAYRALYTAGELDEHGVPVKVTEEEIDNLLERYDLKPNLTPLDQRLEGHVEEKNGVLYHTYPWKLFDLKACLAQLHSERTYDLYTISFKSSSDLTVRQDAKAFFEEEALGIIVDSARHSQSWPQKLFGHYGEFDVEYQLIDRNIKLDSYNHHRDFANYTYRLITCYWNLDRISKEIFRDKCLFYLVPIKNGEIDNDALLNSFSFFRPHQGIVVNDLVKLDNIYQTHRDERTRSYIVEQIHHDMTIRSRVPETKRGETFLDRAIEKYGPNLHADLSMPIIEVKPIAQEVARTSLGKKVEVDQTTKSIHFPAQFLKLYRGDVAVAYQAYMLPEIIYKIYLTTLATDLNDEFQRATALEQGQIIKKLDVKAQDPYPWLPTEDELEEEEVVKQGAADRPTIANDEQISPDQDSDEEMDVEETDSNLSPLEEDIHDEEYSSTHEICDSDEEESSPRPTNHYLDVLSRRKLNLNDHGRSDWLEKWDMDQYEPQDLKEIDIQVKTFEASQKFINYDPKLPDDSVWVCSIVDRARNISNALAQFKTGIMGQSELPTNEEIYERPGKVVDMSIMPPITLDRMSEAPRLVPYEMDLLEALTQRRSGEKFNLEALENIGDSYLKYSVSVILYQRVNRNEGQLTYARSRLVSNKHFARLAKKNKLGFYAICHKFDMEILNATLGGRVTRRNKLRPKDLADMVESLIGACLVRRGEHQAIMAMKWLGLNIFQADTFRELHRGAVVFNKPEPERHYGDPKIEQIRKEFRMRLKPVEEILSYSFIDKFLLVQAFTHASSVLRCTESYERLEFLGDAVLDFIVTMTLYSSGLYETPGQLTSSRSALVNNCAFAKLAITYKLDMFIQHTNQELFDELNKVNEYAKSDPDLEFLGDFRYDRISKLLGDIFESVAGAIYIDSGCSLDAVQRVFYPMMKENIDAEIANPTKDIVRQLFELFPGRDRIKFEFIKASDDEGCDLKHAICTIHGLGQFHGEGLNNHHAKKRAAASVMENLPSDEQLRKLNLDYKLLIEGLEGDRRGRGRGRGGRSRGGGGGRGRSVGAQRGRGNYSRRLQQPYPQRSDHPYGRGRF